MNTMLVEGLFISCARSGTETITIIIIMSTKRTRTNGTMRVQRSAGRGITSVIRTTTRAMTIAETEANPTSRRGAIRPPLFDRGSLRRDHHPQFKRHRIHTWLRTRDAGNIGRQEPKLAPTSPLARLQKYMNY